MNDGGDAEIKRLTAACLELEEQVKLLVKTELKLRRTQAELVDSKRKIEEANRTLEEKVRERTRELERKNVELADFTSIVSHDLKEPLRKISVFGDRLRELCGPALDERGRDFVDRIRISAARMARLIDDLLAYTRVTTRLEPCAAVDLSRILDEVLTDLEVTIEKTAARVDASPLPAIEADPVQMRQLFQNLVGNALKFHAPDRPPVVRVSCRRLPDDGDCEIVFEDNGIGIAPEHFERIFGVFQRLHSREDYEGSGIGLAVCKKIAERHGGSISVESAPGEGAKFIVRLPLRRKPAQSGL
jgi:light-regulated signal transduction histidine kinase (bacteriophytochrome)